MRGLCGGRDGFGGRLYHSRHSKLAYRFKSLACIFARFGGCPIIPSNGSLSFPKRYQVTAAISDLNFGYDGFLCESMGNQAGKCGRFRDS